MGYANVPVIKVNRVEMYADRTDVGLHIDFRKGQQIGFIQGTALKADGKEYKVTDATVIKLGEPYTMMEDTLSLTLTFEPMKMLVPKPQVKLSPTLTFVPTAPNSSLSICLRSPRRA